MRIPNSVSPIATGAICLAFYSATGINAQSPCKRPAERRTADGATITLTETRNFHCTVQIAPTGVVLRASDGGKVEDISYSVARGPDGRFYTSARGTAAEVTVWNPDGSFMRNIGRLGQGPGEFAAGTKFIQFDSRGRMYAGDNNRRISVFDSKYEFVFHIPATSIGTGLENANAVLADGTILTTMGSRDNAFRILDANKRDAPTPPVLRAFGPALTINASPRRRLSYSKGDTFWAGPQREAGSGYTLEQWRTDGTLLRVIRREVPWMPRASGTVAGPSTSQPYLQVLHEHEGLLFVAWMIPLKSYSELTPAERRNRGPGTLVDKAVHNYFEVIDANAGVVLASSGPFAPSQAGKNIPVDFFRGGRVGYLLEENADGFVTIRVVELKIVAQK